ncbi:hypothetical protein GCM10011504_50820 [Siccirubricoccus deserti]|nr:hypothetical protein GCM10011504_50820 [Siccirubricoccus deserti]
MGMAGCPSCEISVTTVFRPGRRRMVSGTRTVMLVAMVAPPSVHPGDLAAGCRPNLADRPFGPGARRHRPLLARYAGLRRSDRIRGSGGKVKAIATAPSPIARELKCIPA